jgi:putative transposase
MADCQSLVHPKWECKYHVVWIPKYHQKKLFGELCKELGPVLRALAQQKGGEIVEAIMPLATSCWYPRCA